MSTLTKILIVLLTFFSIFLCGVVVNFIAAAENYKEEYEKTRVDRDAAKQKYDAEIRQANETIAKMEQKKNVLTSQIASLETTNSQLQNDLKSTEREKASLLQKVNNWTSIVADFRETNEQQGKTLENTLRRLETVEAEKIKQEKELNEINRTLIEKLAIIDSIQAEKKRLTEENVEMENRLNMVLQPAGKIAAAPSPVTPSRSVATAIPETVAQNINLQGLVKEVDVKNSMVGISIGTADGVKDGMTFHITRRDEFICDILIIDTDTEEAVGAMDVVHKQPKVGDKVSTNF